MFRNTWYFSSPDLQCSDLNPPSAFLFSFSQGQHCGVLHLLDVRQRLQPDGRRRLLAGGEAPPGGERGRQGARGDALRRARPGVLLLSQLLYFR